MFLERVSRLLSRNYPTANLKFSESIDDDSYRFDEFKGTFCANDGKEMVPMSKLAGSYYLISGPSNNFPWLIYMKFVALHQYFILNSSLMRDEGDFVKGFTTMEKLLYKSITVFFFAIYDMLKLPKSDWFIIFFVNLVERSYNKLSNMDGGLGKIKNYSKILIEQMFEKIDYLESVDILRKITDSSDLYFFEKFGNDSVSCSSSELLSAFGALFIDDRSVSMEYGDADWKERVKGRKKSDKTFSGEYAKLSRETLVSNDYQYLSKYLGLYDAEKLLSVGTEVRPITSGRAEFRDSIPRDIDESRARGLFAILHDDIVFVPVEDSMFSKVPEDVVEIVDNVPENIVDAIYFVKDLGIFLNPNESRTVDILPGLTIETAKGGDKTFWDDRPYSKLLRIIHLVDIFLLLSFNVESLDAEVSIYGSDKASFIKYLRGELDSLPGDFMSLEVSTMAKIEYVKSKMLDS